SLRLRYRPLEYAFGESNAPSTVRRTSPKLRKRASEAEAKLKRLYDAIENGIIDVSDPTLMERVTELKAIRDQARADAERAEGPLDRLGPSITTAGAENFRQPGPQAHAD